METVEFVVNDESLVNDKGFCLVNSGARLQRYETNPCMLFMHDMRQVIGKWENLRIDGDKMYHTAVFDDADPEAARIQGKVDRGFLKGASLGILPVHAEWRTNAEGREILYVTEWEWLECSIVSIPSNAGALSVQVYDNERKPVAKENLSAYLDHVVQLSAGENPINKLKHKPMSINLTAQTCATLGISLEADASTIENAVQKLAARAEELAKKLKNLQDEQEKALKLQAETLVQKAIETGKITADKKDKYIQLAMTNPEMAEEVIDSLPGKTSYSPGIKPIGLSSIPSDRADWTAMDWMKKDMPGLKQLKANDPETYMKLFNL